MPNITPPNDTLNQTAQPAPLYTSKQMAREIGCSLRSMQRFIKRLYPKKTGWRRFDEKEFAAIKTAIEEKPPRSYRRRHPEQLPIEPKRMRREKK